MEYKIFDIVTDLLRDDISKSDAIGRLLLLHDVKANAAVCEHKDEEQFSLADMEKTFYAGWVYLSLEKPIDFEEWLKRRG